MNDESTHLNLEELLAEVNGEAGDDATREHLASCERCRAEAARWGTVARGVRDLAAHAGPPDVALPELPRQARRPGRRVLATSAAAGILLLGGASYGLANAPTGSTSASPGSASLAAKLAALKPVTGCVTLAKTSGTLEQVSGASLVIKTSGGVPITVITSADTAEHDADASPDVITDGAPVTVWGHGSAGAIAATMIGIGRHPGPGTIDVPPGFVAAQGTVADAGTGGFTVATSGGTRVRVTRSTATVIGLLGQGTLSQLRVGGTVVAIGSAEKDGSLAAMEVVQIPAGIDTAQFSVQSCSAESVDSAINTALTPGA
jgi:hypothetical protein